ncbi:MAG: dihydroorotate dehydrogenase electron transfer subunit [Candidatus Hodarchaeota archaeon]
MTKNIIRTVKIIETIEECKDIKTITFQLDNTSTPLKPKPGQFVMVWVPGVDEIPMSISGCDNEGRWSITVKNVGECSNELFNLDKGDFIGIRGPLGNYFKLPEQNSINSILIGGGIGTAPLKFLASELLKRRFKTIIIEGATNNNELIFANDFKDLDTNLSEIIYCTDDGSYGLEGLASSAFEILIKKKKKIDLSNTMVFACGPESMLYKILKICEKYNIELQVSLERIMRCGCGLCGLCVIDPIGLLVCEDGPVFDLKLLRKMDDFGKFKRDFSGKKISINNSSTR